MKVSKKNFQRGGYYENRTDFVLAPQDYAALGSAYDDKTRAYLNSQAKAKLDSEKKAKEGIQAFENRTKVMNKRSKLHQQRRTGCKLARKQSRGVAQCEGV